MSWRTALLLWLARADAEADLDRVQALEAVHDLSGRVGLLMPTVLAGDVRPILARAFLHRGKHGGPPSAQRIAARAGVVERHGNLSDRG
jgi:hypothetical protein